jgi:hypothetical protein
MSLFVYMLCALTSLACSVLLMRSYFRTRTRLLLWSALCFACMFINNAMVIVDYRIFPAHDLSIVRITPAIIGIALLLFGLIWDSE